MPPSPTENTGWLSLRFHPRMVADRGVGRQDLNASPEEELAGYLLPRPGRAFTSFNACSLVLGKDLTF